MCLMTKADATMSDNFFDPLWTEKVTVPVKRVGDTWEFFYGGDVPVKGHAWCARLQPRADCR